MILKKIELNNIRSYSEEKIIFPKGAFMLSGDIGSGKSTILLAIEFALFGLLRGEIAGNSLLRHGCDRGFVSLEFEINNKSYRIGRFLKRSSQGISQDTGFIISEGLQEDLSASELKARILTIIGYPQSLATKGKNSLYRYTVYTPQEEMRKILLDSPEERLEVLRRIFLIDKYKIVQENAKTYSRILRERCKFLEGTIKGLEEKKKLLKEKESGFEVLASKISTTEISLREAIKLSDESRKILETLTKKVEELRDATRIQESEKSNTTIQKASLERCNKRITEIGTIPEKIKEKLELLKKQESEEAKKIEKINYSIIEMSKNKASMQTKTESINELSARINSLEVCPVCMQKVDHEHKQSYKTEQEIKTTKIKEELERITIEEEKTKELLASERKTIENTRIEISNTRLLLLKNEERTRIITEKEIIMKNLLVSETKINNLTKIIDENKGIIGDFDKEKKTFDEYMRAEREILASATSLRREAEISRETITLLKKEVTIMEQASKKLEKISTLASWLSEHFIKKVSSIEKQVLSKVYHSLNEIFTSTFTTLVSDGTLSVRLDDSFSPVIIQNGYETSYESLSGGERTACALAYRIALNKVVGEVVGSLRTGGLLILDEPTDGFSEEQLDSLRDVLNNMNFVQICIVSHEQKIEGFVEKVLRVVKEGHSSKVNEI
ncbi:AAA family ATPase [Candidatus Woesearchaeota archaeon]|nr:AAA family ATPase [Candidatus Woesearchaeota archaeon]